MLKAAVAATSYEDNPSIIRVFREVIWQATASGPAKYDTVAEDLSILLRKHLQCVVD